MLKKYLVLALSVLVINLSLSAVAFAKTNEEKDAEFAEKVKAQIATLGTGTDAKIEVKLKDGTKLKGYVVEIADDHFCVMDSSTAKSTSVSYPQVKQAKGHSHKSNVIFAIGFAAVIVLLFVVFHAQRNNT